MTAKLEVLSRIADLLERKVTDKQFNMEVWWGKRNGEVVDARYTGEVSCKTVGCAIGWAVHYKVRGLALKFRKSVKAVDTGCVLACPRVALGYGPMTHVAEALGIPGWAAVELFHPRSYQYTRMTRRSVIAKIRKFVKRCENERGS